MSLSAGESVPGAEDPGAEEAARPEAAVAAEGVGFAYKERRALDGVSFRVEPGEIFGFLGPNGGGKTTLFRILATLLPPQEGTVRMFGGDLRREAARVRRFAGVVFQAPSLDPLLTARENLLHQGHLYGLSGGELEGRITELLARFGLGERRRERAGKLSGGLARRLEIAKALLHQPRLLLLDEPSTGLDPGARRDLWGVLEGLRETGVTVLLTTHFMEEGDRCDRLALLDTGKIAARGTPAELKAAVGGDVVTLASEEPEALARELEGRSEWEISATVHAGAVRFEHREAHALVARLAAAFPGRIDALTVARPTLEDAFLRATGHGLWDEREKRT